MQVSSWPALLACALAVNTMPPRAQRRGKVLLAWCEGLAAERAERIAADSYRVYPPLAQVWLPDSPSLGG